MHEPKARQAPLENLNVMLILFSTLVLLYALLLSWFSWSEEKNARTTELRTIAEMGEKSIDYYFTQLQADLQQLAMNWNENGDTLDLQRAYRDVQRYQQLRPEMINLAVLLPALPKSPALRLTGKHWKAARLTRSVAPCWAKPHRSGWYQCGCASMTARAG